MRTSSEAAKRDAVLDSLEVIRGDLIDEARRVADDIDRRNGRVTAPEVMEEMRKGAYRHDLERFDPRWMGAVFRRGWTRIDWSATGSHGRPVAVWTRHPQ